MANQELAEYIMEQLSPLEEVRKLPMMGGYIFYYREKVIGGIYQGRFLVKDVPAARKYMPDSVPELPYPGAGKPRLPVTILEDGKKLCAMVEEMFPQLPQRRPRKRKTEKG